MQALHQGQIKAGRPECSETSKLFRHSTPHLHRLPIPHHAARVQHHGFALLQPVLNPGLIGIAVFDGDRPRLGPPAFDHEHAPGGAVAHEGCAGGGQRAVFRLRDNAGLYQSKAHGELFGTVLLLKAMQLQHPQLHLHLGRNPRGRALDEKMAGSVWQPAIPTRCAGRSEASFVSGYLTSRRLQCRSNA